MCIRDRVNGERVDALSMIVHRSNSVHRGREVAAKMRELIPRQMFDVAIQASIGANIIARETVKAMRKKMCIRDRLNIHCRQYASFNPQTYRILHQTLACYFTDTL